MSALTLQAALLAFLLPAGPGFAQTGDRQWSFSVFLDDKPIGTHVFTLQERNTHQELRSAAGFTVKVLGLTLYRYEHLATEHWKEGCLVALDARSNDDGAQTTVRVRLEGSALTVDANGTRESLRGCVKTFAYWDPAILKADRLLNAQTGRWERVTIEAQGRDRWVDAQGQASVVNRFRIVGPDQPITLWYDDANRWVGLQSLVGRGRKLTYRLR